jgi:hypothetical protein
MASYDVASIIRQALAQGDDTVVLRAERQREEHDAQGRAVQVDPVKPTLKLPGTERLKLKCDILLSTAAFKFNFRRCMKEIDTACEGLLLQRFGLTVDFDVEGAMVKLLREGLVEQRAGVLYMATPLRKVGPGARRTTLIRLHMLPLPNGGMSRFQAYLFELFQPRMKTARELRAGRILPYKHTTMLLNCPGCCITAETVPECPAIQWIARSA